MNELMVKFIIMNTLLPGGAGSVLGADAAAPHTPLQRYHRQAGPQEDLQRG